MHVVRLIDLSRSVGSTRSRLTSLRVELDSHVDTCVVGKNALVIHEHPNIVMVSGFDPSQPPRRATVVDAAIRYTCCDTGDHLILMINQAIYIPEVDHCLLCPMQFQINGVEINEVPKFLTQNPTTSTHSIRVAVSTDA
jgi:hypothetical protein